MSQTTGPTPVAPVPPPSATFFVVMRRMRTPLIVLILLFGISVAGLAVIPGSSPEGPWRMGLFDAFYFMSYTASTIGFGEIPQAFNTAQRLWVTLSIYLTVVGWAYAIGALLTTLQDKSLRYARALQSTRRQVARIPTSFWLMAGHGQTGELVGVGLDQLGQRFVAVDRDETRIESLDLGAYLAEVPGVVGDARNPDVLTIAGLTNPRCSGVLAITDDEEANLAIVMNVSVLRPGLPVIARSTDPTIQRRMREFGEPTIVDPFDRFGDHLGIALRAPTAERLAAWLTSAPGAPLPPPAPPLRRGRWVVCGYGRFGRQVAKDLRRDGQEVVAVDAREWPDEQVVVVVGNGTEPEVLVQAGVADAAGFVAGTDNDTTNLSLITAARRLNPDLSIVVRQNSPTNHALFEAMHADLLMVPADVVAADTIAHIGTPLLWQFLSEIGHQDEAAAAALLDRVTDACGHRSPDLWTVAATALDSPALMRLPSGLPALGDLLRDPTDRESRLDAVVLLVKRGASVTTAPPDDVVLQPDDELLVAGRPAAWRAMETTIQVDSAASYVVTGHRIPAGWLWRRLTGRSRQQAAA